MKHLIKFEGIDDYNQLSGWVNVKIDEQICISTGYTTNI